MILNRESIKRGIIRDMIRKTDPPSLNNWLSDAERQESLRTAMKDPVSGEPVWVFGYGSLMWNPAFHFAEQRGGLVHGYHRRFCMWIAGGRGTPEVPGLMLALDRGGSCRGMAFRIAPDQVDEELDIIWSREMGSGSYRARWVNVRTDRGVVRALTFVIDRNNLRYSSAIPRDLMIAHIANARGWLGSCAEYLANTVAHLRELGIEDGPMHDMLNRVHAHTGGTPTGRWEDGRWLTAAI